MTIKQHLGECIPGLCHCAEKAARQEVIDHYTPAVEHLEKQNKDLAAERYNYIRVLDVTSALIEHLLYVLEEEDETRTGEDVHANAVLTARAISEFVGSHVRDAL